MSINRHSKSRRSPEILVRVYASAGNRELNPNPAHDANKFIDSNKKS